MRQFRPPEIMMTRTVGARRAGSVHVIARVVLAANAALSGYVLTDGSRVQSYQAVELTP